MVKRVSIILIVSAIICGSYYIYLTRQNPRQLSLDAATVDNAPAIGGSFNLVDQDGKKVSDESLKGKKLLVFFGYTSCPDVCPVTMAVLTEVMNQLDETKVKNVQPVFITTDPDKDKPAVLKKYMKDYHHSFIGLTGSKEELEKAMKAYKVYAEDAPAGDEHMDMEAHGDMKDHAQMGHSSLIYFMDENGKYLTHFNGESAPEDIVDYIATH